MGAKRPRGAPPDHPHLIIQPAIGTTQYQ